MEDLNLTLEQSLSFSDGRMFRSSCLDPSEWSDREISAYRLLWQTVYQETALFILPLIRPICPPARILTTDRKQALFATE